MDGARTPAVAGSFYPGDLIELDAMVHRLLGAAAPPAIDIDLRVLIVPHAGLAYSGPVAATAYALVDGAAVRRVVLLGPSHFRGFAGLALSGQAGFATPLGSLSIDESLADIAAAHARPIPAAHAREHSLEVQLPFLQSILREFSFLPVLTGDHDPAPGTALLEDVVDAADLIVISSDLSHYEDHQTAQRIDAGTAAAIVALDAGAIGPRQACGRTAVQAALMLAAKRGWTCRQLDLRTSADTAGDPARVVGYGAFALGV